MVDISKSGDTCTLRISGRFDFRCVKEFQDALQQHSRKWIVDFDGVNYIDSAALGMLLLLREHAGENGRVGLRRLAGQPRDVLLMAKFERLFIFED